MLEIGMARYFRDMERELFFRIEALLDNLEENVLYVLRDPKYKNVSISAVTSIRKLKTHIGLESSSPLETRKSARITVDAAERDVLSYIKTLNDREGDAYRFSPDQLSAISHVNNRYDLISRLIKEARRKVDGPEPSTRLVPREAPAPVRVVVRDQRLELVAPKHHIGSVPDPSVDKLRLAARDILRRSMTALAEAGNADPRFLPCCEGLVQELTAPLDTMSVEAVGLNWQIVTEALDLSQDSIPDLIIAQVRRALTTINVILGQYEEWQIYLTAEAGTKLSSNDVAVLAKQALSLVEDFSKSPETADIRIADRIRLIVDPLATGIIQTDTIGVPLIGSVSNIFAALSHVALESLPGGSSISGQISGSILLTNLSILFINKFAPTLSEFPPLSWLSGVHSEISKHWSIGKDVIKPL